MKTKTVKLENDFAQLSRANGKVCVSPSRFFACHPVLLLAVGQPVVPSRQRNNDEDQQRLEDDNRRLKTRVNKLIDEVKGQKEELEKKKREVSNLKRIAASRKLDSVNNSTLTGKKRPATAGEVVASQGPTQRQAAEEVHTSTLSTAAPPQLGDDTSHMALLNSYKTR